MRAEPPCLFGDSSWFWEASSPTLRASACPFGLRRSSGAILTIPIITLTCSGESLESCASSPKAGVPQAMRKDLCFLFSWHCLHRVWWGWQGSLKPLLVTLQRVCSLLQTRLLTTNWIHCAVSSKGRIFAMKEASVCRFLDEHMQLMLGLPWGTRQPSQAGSKVGSESFLLLNPGRFVHGDKAQDHLFLAVCLNWWAEVGL